MDKTDKELREQADMLRSLASIYRGAGLRYGIEKDLEGAAEVISSIPDVRKDAAQGELEAIINYLENSTIFTVPAKGGALEWLKERARDA
jgi:hypothetical protein